VFIADRYTDRGKWMDGWESRRRRGPGHDWCILALGARGVIDGFDIDTRFFDGNHPAFASVEGLLAAPDASLSDLSAAEWQELLSEVPLSASCQNLFAAQPRGEVNYLRLNIYPDGGVARFRSYGRVSPDWRLRRVDEQAAQHVSNDDVDLAALLNGACPLACSNAHFSPMHQALMPGRAADMGAGWETRRRRGPGHDWLVVALGARGVPRVVEVDTQHFKGNYPARCSVDVLDQRGAARITELIASEAWQTLLPEMKLDADMRHFFRDLPELSATHVRLNLYPDGGVSRLRVWGRPL
jgi:allantoicase